MLDRLFPNTPAIVLHLSGHGGYANSAALERAGIDENTENPIGGYYEKDENGRLTGYLAGQPALFSVKTYPNPTPETAVIPAHERAKMGITTASEFALMNTFVLEGLQFATKDKEFPVRIVGGLFSTIENFDEVAPRVKSHETDLFKIPFIKTWTDGSIQGGTAHLTEGYYTETGGEGGAQGTQEFFTQQVERMYELGFWPAIHANGDGAVDVALNAIESAQKKFGKEKTAHIRPQIIHANYTREDQIPRMKELGALPTFFPTHIYYFGEVHANRTLGPERAEGLMLLPMHLI
jgi:predicted amidohydrolase YtcJ